MCAGCVHALNTNRRGASMRRVMTSSRLAALAPASTWLLLALQSLQIALKSIEALFPEDAVQFEPFRRSLQRTRFQPARPPLRLSPAHDQSGAFQDLKVLGYGRKTNRERLG